MFGHFGYGFGSGVSKFEIPFMVLLLLRSSFSRLFWMRWWCVGSGMVWIVLRTV